VRVRGTMQAGQGMRGAGRGAQLLELALVLPILLLLVVGVWDFGSLLLLKDRLTNAAREGARIAVSNPLANPFGSSCGTVPCSIQAAHDAVVQYLNNAGLDASCLAAAAPAQSGFVWAWQCNGNGIALTIDRAATVLTPGDSTRVSLSWPLRWMLQQLMPANTFPASVTTNVSMKNLT